MLVKFAGGDYGEILQSEGWFRELGHKGIEIGDSLVVQLDARPDEIKLSDHKKKVFEEIKGPTSPIYDLNGKIVITRNDRITRDIWKDGIRNRIEIIRTILIADCGIPVRVISEKTLDFKEGEIITFSSRIGGIMGYKLKHFEKFTTRDIEPIVMPVKGKVKEKFEREDYTVYITLDVEEIGKLKIQEDYPFWIENK